MLNEQIVRLLSLMHIHPPTDSATGSSIVKRLKFGKKKSAPKFGSLPEAVW